MPLFAMPFIHRIAIPALPELSRSVFGSIQKGVRACSGQLCHAMIVLEVLMGSCKALRGDCRSGCCRNREVLIRDSIPRTADSARDNHLTPQLDCLGRVEALGVYKHKSLPSPSPLRSFPHPLPFIIGTEVQFRKRQREGRQLPVHRPAFGT